MPLSLDKAIILGAGGQLGSVLSNRELYEVELIPVNKQELNLTQHSDYQILDSYDDIRFIINCAAFTQIDLAEHDKALALATNGHAVSLLARYCKDRRIKLIHISTDSVFSDQDPIFHKHHDDFNPVNHYSLTKAIGETSIVSSGLMDYSIIRTSWLYGASKQGFVPTVIKNLHAKKPFTVVNDQYGQPTYVADLAQLIINLLTFQPNTPIVHAASPEYVSRFEFARNIAEFLGFDGRLISPVTTTPAPGIAPRPSYSLLDIQRESRVQGLSIPTWHESLTRYANLFKLDNRV